MIMVKWYKILKIEVSSCQYTMEEKLVVFFLNVTWLSLNLNIES